MRLNQNGFSLVELMVVVAIIGVIASFSIPQYRIFQSKARQKEAATLLSSYMTSAQAAFSEYGKYPGNFASSGFAPSGQIHYQITVADNSTGLPSGAPVDSACVITSDDCSAAPTGFKQWTEETSDPAFKVIAAETAPSISDTTFLAVASGVIKPGGSIDEWTLTEGKVIAPTAGKSGL